MRYAFYKKNQDSILLARQLYESVFTVRMLVETAEDYIEELEDMLADTVNGNSITQSDLEKMQVLIRMFDDELNTLTRNVSTESPCDTISRLIRQLKERSIYGDV